MRLIYQDGKQVSGDPVGHHVYLWRADETDRYVGKASAGQTRRWKQHTKYVANSENRRKERYFRRFASRLSCFILAEALPSEEDLGEREIVEIDKRGTVAAGTGPLLNARGGSVFYAPRSAPGERSSSTSQHHDDWKAQPDLAPTATIRLLTTDNIWAIKGRAGKNGRGYQFFVKVLAKGPKTVQEAIDLGKKIGLTPGQVQEHLRWLYTWGPYMEIDGRLWQRQPQLHPGRAEIEPSREIYGEPKLVEDKPMTKPEVHTAADVNGRRLKVVTRTQAFLENRNRPLLEDWTIKLIGIPKSWSRGPNRGQGGHDFLNLLQTHEPQTVGEANRLAATIGMSAAKVRLHLWWAYTEPCLEINGLRFPALPQ
jgi:hypothetical protein